MLPPPPYGECGRTYRLETPAKIPSLAMCSRITCPRVFHVKHQRG
jgi:hypothetical protein